MMYLTIDDWDEMGGSADMDEPVYNRLEYKARKLIDQLTRGRIAGDKKVRESVRYCMYEMITAMAAEESAAGIGGREVDSVSNDGVSVTYASGEGSDSKVRMIKIIKNWLADETTDTGVPLLYAGVDA